MRIVQAPRASAILYNLLVSHPQDKTWLIPANICPIVPITFMKAKVPFEFVDISAQTLHMDEDQAGELIKRRAYGGLLYAHTYGDESTPDDFFNLAGSLNPEMLIVDDRCLCAPAFPVNSPVDVTLFSTGYAKIVDLEFGGYALLGGGIAYQPVSLPFHPGDYLQLEERYKSAVKGNLRFEYRESDWLLTDADLPAWDEYHRKIGTGLESSLAHRKTLNEIYSSQLPDEIQMPPPYQSWRFNIRVKNKGRILKAIFENGLFASSHYASLAGLMSDGLAPHAAALADEVINLFNDHHFTADMAERVCGMILETL